MIELCRIHTLTVAVVDHKGIWLETGGDLAHLPLREVSDALPGDELQVFVYRDSAGLLHATCKMPLAQEGAYAELTVKSVGPHGAFLDWGLGKDLLAPFSLQPERMQVGESYMVKVEVDEQGRPFANAKIDELLETATQDLRAGEPVKLLVRQFTDLGAKIIVNNRFNGLLYRDELPDRLAVGTTLNGYVKHVRDDGKIDVTLRKIGAEGIADARETILAALGKSGGMLPLSDATSPEVIRDTLGMSKKTFKKAVGGLYKDGIVSLDNNEVRLKKQRPRKP